MKVESILHSSGSSSSSTGQIGFMIHSVHCSQAISLGHYLSLPHDEASSAQKSLSRSLNLCLFFLWGHPFPFHEPPHPASADDITTLAQEKFQHAGPLCSFLTIPFFEWNSSVAPVWVWRGATTVGRNGHLRKSLSHLSILILWKHFLGVQSITVQIHLGRMHSRCAFDTRTEAAFAIVSYFAK